MSKDDESNIEVELNEAQKMMKYLVGGLTKSIENKEKFIEKTAQLMTAMERKQWFEMADIKDHIRQLSNKQELVNYQKSTSYANRDDLIKAFFDEVIVPRLTHTWESNKAELLLDGDIEISADGRVLVNEKFYERKVQELEMLKSKKSELDTLQNIKATMEYFNNLPDGETKDEVGMKLIAIELEKSPHLHICSLCNQKDDCDKPFAYFYRNGRLSDIYIEIFGENSISTLVDNSDTKKQAILKKAKDSINAYIH